MLSKSTEVRVLLLAALWGSEFLFVKVALRGIGPVELMFCRLLLSALLLFGVSLAKDESFPRDKMLYLHCVVLGFVAAALPYFLMGWAQQRISSALTGILIGVGPLLTAGLAALFLPHERLSAGRLVGLCIGLGGVVLVIDPSHTTVGTDLAGDVAALGVAACFAVAYVYNVRFLTRHPASGPMIMAIQAVFGALFAGFWLLERGRFVLHVSTETVGSIVILGLLNTGAAAIVFFSLLRSAGAVSTSLVEYLMVVVSMILGTAFLNEHISLVTVAGVVFILAGVSLTENRRERSPKTRLAKYRNTDGTQDRHSLSVTEGLSG